MGSMTKIALVIALTSNMINISSNYTTNYHLEYTLLLLVEYKQNMLGGILTRSSILKECSGNNMTTLSTASSDFGSHLS